MVNNIQMKIFFFMNRIKLGMGFLVVQVLLGLAFLLIIHNVSPSIQYVLI